MFRPQSVRQPTCDVLVILITIHSAFSIRLRSRYSLKYIKVVIRPSSPITILSVLPSALPTRTSSQKSRVHPASSRQRGSLAKVHPDQWIRSVIGSRNCSVSYMWVLISEEGRWVFAPVDHFMQTKHSHCTVTFTYGPVGLNTGNRSCHLSPVWWWALVRDSAQCLGTDGFGWGCGPNYSWGFGSGSSFGDLADWAAGCCGTSLSDDDWSSWWPSCTDGSKVRPPQPQWPEARGHRLPPTHSTSRQGPAAPPLCLLWAPSQTWHPLEGRRTHYWLALE